MFRPIHRGCLSDSSFPMQLKSKSGGATAVISLALLFLLCFNGLGIEFDELNAEKLHDESYTLSNKYVSRTLSWKEGTLTTDEIKNVKTGKVYSPTGEEFVIRMDQPEVPVSPDSMVVKDAYVQDTDDGERLIVRLIDRNYYGTEFRIVYELNDNDFWGRKWIEIFPPSAKTLKVNSVSVEELKFAGVTCTHQGIGQPVYMDDMVFGLEWPTSANLFKQSTVSCTHYPAWNVDQPFASKRCIWGAAPKGRMANWFMHTYLPTIRVSKPIPVLAYHYQAGETFPSRYFREERLRLDAFVAGQGWSNPKSIFKSKTDGTYPSIASLQEQVLDKLPGCKTGVWMPLNGTLAVDAQWAAENQYEKTNDGGFDLLGTKYNEALSAQIVSLIKDSGINYFKNDFNKFACDNTENGHRGGGKSGAESQVEGALKHLSYIKYLNPQAFISFHTGNNVSPWWLMACDSVTVDSIENARFRHMKIENLITAKDVLFQNALAKNSAQFPANGFSQPHLADGVMFKESEAFTKSWENYVMMYLGRGCTNWEFSTSPAKMTPETWNFLAKKISWARQNSKTLAESTRFILGDPAKGEAYGYAHVRRNRVLLFIRNPGMGKNPGLKEEIPLELDAASLGYHTNYDEAKLTWIYPNDREGGDLDLENQIILRMKPNDVFVLELRLK